ncbi:hypothetical protein AAKU67_000694 [Oxalobacteraceae bacterium GrIS 2.11]
MVEVIVFAEGQSDEQFIKRVVAPALRQLNLFLKPEILKTSQQSRGGAITFDRLKFHARNALRQRPNAILTTFLDLYGLDTDFPGFGSAQTFTDVYRRAKCIELAMHAAIVNYVGCQPNRFIPHVQPYEFEGLLFSNPAALVNVEPSWEQCLGQLEKVRSAFPTPEHINDSYETKPSNRLERILTPKYKKTRHGPLIAHAIGIRNIEAECMHFKAWVDRLRGLSR